VSAERDRTGTRNSAQASVEFVALLPVLAALLALAAQTVMVGWALWSAGNAARAGARAERVGSDAEAAARHALPGALRPGAVIKKSDGVRVQVRVPALVPGVDLPAVSAASRLGEDAG
jgi:hypothetical protein